MSEFCNWACLNILPGFLKACVLPLGHEGDHVWGRTIHAGSIPISSTFETAEVARLRAELAEARADADGLAVAGNQMADILFHHHPCEEVIQWNKAIASRPGAARERSNEGHPFA